MSSSPDPDTEQKSTTIHDTLDVLLAFGEAMLCAGATAFRVREGMATMARRLGCDSLALAIGFGSITGSIRRGGEQTAMVREVAPPGVNAARIGALEQFARDLKPGATPRDVAAQLAAIEAVPRHYSSALTTVAVGVASGAFAFLNAGGPFEVIVAAICAGIGQWVRSLLFGRGANQYAATTISAVVAAGLYRLLTMLAAGAGLGMERHVAGLISSVLFLVPGFPLVAALLDLFQHQTVTAVTRFAYGTMLLLAAAFGLSFVIGIAPLPIAPPPPLALGLGTSLLLRGVASFVGGAGFAILFNNSPRTALAVGLLSLLANELRLGLHDAGMMLAPATFLGALAVGLVASLVHERLEAPRIALTVPGIIIMVPGMSALQMVALFNQGQMLQALQAGALCGFVAGAIAMGLGAARFLTPRRRATDPISSS